MIIRYCGAGLTVLAGGAAAWVLAREQSVQEKAISELIDFLDHLASQLQTNIAPLPDACAAAAGTINGCVGRFFKNFVSALQQHNENDASACMRSVIAKDDTLQPLLHTRLLLLGQTFGKYDLEGQIHGIRAVQELCKRDLEGLVRQRDRKLRSYQAIGLCTGAAIAILLL